MSWDCGRTPTLREELHRATRIFLLGLCSHKCCTRNDYRVNLLPVHVVRFEEADGLIDFINGHEVRGGFKKLFLHTELLHVGLHSPRPHLIAGYNKQKKKTFCISRFPHRLTMTWTITWTDVTRGQCSGWWWWWWCCVRTLRPLNDRHVHKDIDVSK